MAAGNAPAPRRREEYSRPDVSRSTGRAPELRALEAPGSRRRARRTMTLLVGIALLLGSLLAVGAARAYLVEGQVRLARLDSQLANATRREQQLQLEVAGLDNPSRILSVAEANGMVQPAKVQDVPQVPLGYRAPPDAKHGRHTR
ncbi:MAG: hypothetical protein M1522_06985 [Actinobacteria bacterium]|nr:hypothetical protein [Actinomycetota bacterium]MDA8184212.1 hypothetical protein [Actinomycetota bacterium]